MGIIDQIIDPDHFRLVLLILPVLFPPEEKDAEILRQHSSPAGQLGFLFRGIFHYCEHVRVFILYQPRIRRLIQICIVQKL